MNRDDTRNQEHLYLNCIFDCSFRFDQFPLYNDVRGLKLLELGILWVPQQVLSNS